jgi:hypothetical protein
MSDENKYYAKTGFFIGVGFSVANQLAWIVFDFLKGVTGLPLG